MADEKPDSIRDVAERRVDAAYALRSDLLDVLFPRGGEAPPEMLQAQVRLVLQSLVRAIECALLGERHRSAKSWEALSSAGLLREPGLIDFALARIAERNVRQRCIENDPAALFSQLAPHLLAGDSERLVELAQALLAADQVRSANDDRLFARLPTDLLHRLCWRIVAALNSDGIDPALLASAKAFLAADHHKDDPIALAGKLCFFLGPDYRATLLNPQRAGLSLFVSALSRESGLDCDALLRILDDSAPEPAMLLARATGLNEEAASNFFALLRCRPSEPALEAYRALDPVEARMTVAKWATPTP